MDITLEKIDELRERKNVSYSVAKKALENANGDMVEAIIYLEKNDLGESKSKKHKKNVESFFKKCKNFRMDILKDDVLSLRLDLLTLLLLLPAFPIVIVGLVFYILSGYKIKFTNKDKPIKVLNDVVEKCKNSVDENLK